jgi:hypothetical protein
MPAKAGRRTMGQERLRRIERSGQAGNNMDKQADINPATLALTAREGDGINGMSCA